MKRAILTFLALTVVSSALVSCSTVKSTMNKVTTPMKSMARVNVDRLKKVKLPSFKKIKFPGFKNDTPPVVKVRQGDLKKMKTAEEKILAWNRLKESQKRQYGSINANGEVFMPVDFNPSDLPVGGQIPTFGILPSLKNGGSTAATIDENAAILPDDVANLPEIPGPVPALTEEKKEE